MKKLIKLILQKRNTLLLVILTIIIAIMGIFFNRTFSLGLILGVFGIFFTAVVAIQTENIRHRDLLFSIAASMLGIIIGLLISNSYIAASNYISVQNEQPDTIEAPAHIAELSPEQDDENESVNKYSVNEGYVANTNEEVFLISNGIIKGKEDVNELSKMDVLIELIKLDMIDNHEIGIIDSEMLNKSPYADYLYEANIAFNKYEEIKNSDEYSFDDRLEMLVEALESRKLGHEQIKTYKNCELIGQYYVFLAEEYLKVEAAGEAYNFYNKAIDYYLQAYKLSVAEGTTDDSLFYKTAICFSNISEIADIDTTVSRDSLYMAIAYFSLYREKDSEHYQNQFYLARNYKMLAMQAEDVYMCHYLLIAKEGFYKCTSVEKLKTKDRIAVYNNIYNIIDTMIGMNPQYLEPDIDIDRLEVEKQDIDNIRETLNSQL